jgi:hypothetical protein
MKPGSLHAIHGSRDGIGRTADQPIPRGHRFRRAALDQAGRHRDGPGTGLEIAQRAQGATP